MRPILTTLANNLVLAAAFVMGSIEAYANETFFLAGDACFPTILTKESVDQFVQSPKSYQFPYDSLGESLAGYAGFDKAVIESADDSFARHLGEAYQIYRSANPRVFIESHEPGGELSLAEINGMKVLFYSAEFDFPNYPIGLTYNEHWCDEIESFGHPRRSVMLNSRVNESEAVANNWRDAAEVPPLKAQFPGVIREPTQKIMLPVRITEKVQAYVPVSGTLEEYWGRTEGKHKDHLLLVVSSGGIEYYTVKNHAWVKLESDDDD